MESKNKTLRSGYTTGACAAAAAKAAAALLMGSAESGIRNGNKPEQVVIPFPDGSRVPFAIQASGFGPDKKSSWASIIKDAGDDPDVTHGAEIRAEVRWNGDFNLEPDILLRGGKGVGTVTKPGLAVPVGEPAINPVPRKMILAAVQEAIQEWNASIPHSALRVHPCLRVHCAGAGCIPRVEVTISVPAGEELAKKTLNNRLGIVGGISILGTTGIVRPVSMEAYTASITAGMDVAKAMGRTAVVLSSGRTSEKAHMSRYHFPDEAYIMMGDYLEFSLLDAKKHGFQEIHLCAQWAKMIKTAMSTPQTHVRHGALEGTEAAVFLRSLGIDVAQRAFNTAREVYDYLMKSGKGSKVALSAVCKAAKQYVETVASGIPVMVNLVSYEGEIIADSR